MFKDLPDWFASQHWLVLGCYRHVYLWRFSPQSHLPDEQLYFPSFDFCDLEFFYFYQCLTLPKMIWHFFKYKTKLKKLKSYLIVVCRLTLKMLKTEEELTLKYRFRHFYLKSGLCFLRYARVLWMLCIGDT